MAAASLLLLCLACHTSLQIKDVKVNDNCDELCLSWITNMDAKCKVSFCDDTQCFVTEVEPEWSLLHSITIPQSAHRIQIWVESRDGQNTVFVLR